MLTFRSKLYPRGRGLRCGLLAAALALTVGGCRLTASRAQQGVVNNAVEGQQGVVNTTGQEVQQGVVNIDQLVPWGVVLVLVLNNWRSNALARRVIQLSHERELKRIELRARSDP